eukprot:m.67358 g.67358  ORF g.67358 m.67358 type:complete len:163 (-) comp12161_c0_seq1:317-805(-)
MKNPARDLPRALFVGLPLVIVVYLLANLAYFSVLPVDLIVDPTTNEPNSAFAASFAFLALGVAGRIVIPLCVAISAFGSANGSAFTGARLVRESAVAGELPSFLGHLWGETDPTPVPALLSQYLISSLMLLSSNFDALVWTTVYFLIYAPNIMLECTHTNTD